MANAYVVASGDEPEHGQQLPRDMWAEVLRHTAARFAVEDVRPMNYSIRRNPDIPNYHDVIYGTADVRLRYEFKLERRRATGPRMLRAHFTRCVCPLFKTTQAWLDLTEAQQEAIEHHFARSAIIAPFLELRVQVHDYVERFGWQARVGRFDFVRRLDARNQPSLMELSPGWSAISKERLISVRDQLRALFHMDLRDQHGQLISF